MKKTARVSHSNSKKAVSYKGKISRVSLLMKRYGKKSLRTVLLSPVFHTTFKVVGVILLASVPFYAAYAYIGKTVANEVVISKSQILDRVATHMTLPPEKPQAVVRVQDADVLKRQNPFYAEIKSGDYIIMYKNQAIIYDLLNDRILATKYIAEETR